MCVSKTFMTGRSNTSTNADLASPLTATKKQAPGTGQVLSQGLKYGHCFVPFALCAWLGCQKPMGGSYFLLVCSALLLQQPASLLRASQAAMLQCPPLFATRTLRKCVETPATLTIDAGTQDLWQATSQPTLWSVPTNKNKTPPRASTLLPGTSASSRLGFFSRKSCRSSFSIVPFSLLVSRSKLYFLNFESSLSLQECINLFHSSPPPSLPPSLATPSAGLMGPLSS